MEIKVANVARASLEELLVTTKLTGSSAAWNKTSSKRIDCAGAVAALGWRTAMKP
jgi:hypothetical protein